ncbi:MAG: saccharopine dehydrogenase NADP-binding domain-containing protein [Chitinophagales bacterium]|nr:saccharopine dehydrogenase NADP-binding domain-containing protein [Chitinophagales bacterium]
MKNILVLGAGKSATTLIQYLLHNAEKEQWNVTVADFDQALAARKIDNNSRGKALAFDVHNAELRQQLVANADLVISILPAEFHYLIAEACLQHHKHLITPSYVSPKEQELDAAFREKGLLMLCEMGLDPGIDHMSLMKTLLHLREQGANIHALRSFCGALIAPESDNNPWHYKFTWAPMNVVMAGSGGTAQYRKNGKPKYIPYNRLFRITEVHLVNGYGEFEAYANRDSLPYIEKYGIEDIPTFVRGTLRRKGFCSAWDALVRLGMTDNQLLVPQNAQFTYRQFLDAFLPPTSIDDSLSTKERLAAFLELDDDSDVMYRLGWLGLWNDKPIPMTTDLTPAQILLDLLEERWQLHDDDKDLIVMLHRFDYTINQQEHTHVTTLVVKGKDPENTAISATVGLPMGIAAKLILQGKLSMSGVHIPIVPEIYDPILAELKTLGIVFEEIVA